MELLEDLDHRLTLYVNNSGVDWLDTVMIIISNKYTWLPLYAFLLLAFYKRMDWRVLILAIAGAAATTALTDLTSVHLFKNVFERWRPCHHLELMEILRLPDGCGGRFGFVSSHATNTAGLAVFAGLVLRNKAWWCIMGFYTLVNSYSRVYLGKHYVSDVVAGTILGLTIGVLVYLLYMSIANRFLKPNTP